MNDPSYADWVLVIFFFGVMCMSAYTLGDAVSQTVLRIKSRERRASYEKWGRVHRSLATKLASVVRSLEWCRYLGHCFHLFYSFRFYNIGNCRNHLNR